MACIAPATWLISLSTNMLMLISHVAYGERFYVGGDEVCRCCGGLGNWAALCADAIAEIDGGRWRRTSEIDRRVSDGCLEW